MLTSCHHATFLEAISLVSMNMIRRLLGHHSHTSRILILNMMIVSSTTVRSTSQFLYSACASMNASRTIAICAWSVRDEIDTYSYTYIYILGSVYVYVFVLCVSGCLRQILDGFQLRAHALTA